MQVDEKTAAAKSEYKGDTFYFCSQECKRRFDADPERYAPAPEQPDLTAGFYAPRRSADRTGICIARARSRSASAKSCRSCSLPAYCNRLAASTG